MGGIRKVRKNLQETADGRPADGGQIFKSSGDYRQEIRDARDAKRAKVDQQKEDMTEKWKTDETTGVQTKQPKQKVGRKKLREDFKEEKGKIKTAKKADRKEERDAYRTAKTAGKTAAKAERDKGSKWTTDEKTGVRTKSAKKKLNRRQIRKNAVTKATKTVEDNRKAKASAAKHTTSEYDALA